MTKAEFVERVASKTDQSKALVEEILREMIDQVTAALKKGDDVSFVGFGTFKVRSSKARMGRNPSTGATINIPAKKVPVFRAGQGLKAAVSGAKK